MSETKAFYKQVVTRKTLKWAAVNVLEMADEHSERALQAFADEKGMVSKNPKRTLLRYAVDTDHGMRWREPVSHTDEWYDYDYDGVVMYEYVWISELVKPRTIKDFRLESVSLVEKPLRPEWAVTSVERD